VVEVWEREVKWTVEVGGASWSMCYEMVQGGNRVSRRRAGLAGRSKQARRTERMTDPVLELKTSVKPSKETEDSTPSCQLHGYTGRGGL
jgi:hypothetical protein